MSWAVEYTLSDHTRNKEIMKGLHMSHVTIRRTKWKEQERTQ
jgi:hypothetical protein